MFIEFSFKKIIGVGFPDYPVLMSGIGSRLDKQINHFSARDCTQDLYIKIQNLQNKVNNF